MKKERLELEKEPDNFGLRTPYAGFAPLTPHTTGFAPKTQEHSQENLTEKNFNYPLSPYLLS